MESVLTTLPFQRLAAWREANNLSLTEAGKKIGVHGPTWHEWETGGRIPLGGYRDALEILTGIPASEWMPERERRAIETARESVASDGPRVDRDPSFSQLPTEAP